MAASKILLIEDDTKLCDFNKINLEKAGYTVSFAATLSEARRQTASFRPDLIVLDILMPDGSGIDFCRELRADSFCPILFLTNLTETEQIIRGLHAGGDDYMVKPYRIEELLARIEAHLRRAAMTSGTSLRLEAGKDVLTLDARLQRACLNGRNLLLKPKEYQILSYLMQNRNRYVSANELYGEIWGVSSNQDVRTVFVHISNIRAKLKAADGKNGITLGKSKLKGYRLISECGEVGDDL